MYTFRVGISARVDKLDDDVSKIWDPNHDATFISEYTLGMATTLPTVGCSVHVLYTVYAAYPQC